MDLSTLMSDLGGTQEPDVKGTIQEGVVEPDKELKVALALSQSKQTDSINALSRLLSEMELFSAQAPKAAKKEIDKIIDDLGGLAMPRTPYLSPVLPAIPVVGPSTNRATKLGGDEAKEKASENTGREDHTRTHLPPKPASAHRERPTRSPYIFGGRLSRRALTHMNTQRAHLTMTDNQQTPGKSGGSDESGPSRWKDKGKGKANAAKVMSGKADKEAANQPINPLNEPGRFVPGPPGTFMDLGNINLALGLDINGRGTPNLDNNGAFPPFLSNPLSPESKPSPGGMQQQRQAPSPQQQQANNGAPNGIGMAINGMGLGNQVTPSLQMDVNLVYQKVMELSEVLRENREKTQGIVNGAEELAARAAANGAAPSLQEANHEISAARIADLTRQVHELQKVKQILFREQHENTKLIGEYETALGNIVEQIRNFSYAKDMEKTKAARDYNKLLQDEKDAHLATRLEKDDWHAKFMRSVEMLRTAYRMRCEEEEVPLRIIAGLQSEVRGYRHAMGMEAENFEEETGYEILKDVKNGAGEPY